MFKISKKVNFESAHQLAGHPKCGNLHGHSYKVEIVITGEKIDPKTGFIVDFGVISDSIKSVYDHSGDIIQMSAEKLALKIAKQIRDLIQIEVEGIKVKVWETESSWAEYTDTSADFEF